MSAHHTNAAQLLPEANLILATKGRTFHWARYLLGRVYGERATRLYRYCRHLDDLVDEAGSSEQAQAALFRHRRELLTGQSDDLLVADALSLMAQCQVDPRYALELIDGVESDLKSVRVSDTDELLRYCYKVAGTVGLMMTGVLDVKCARALPHAIDLGIAMQLTNICRDVAEDASLNRRYLPASLVGDLDMTCLMRPEPAVQIELRAGLRQLLDLAERYYKSGEEGLHYLPLNARAAILVAARVYREIGEVLKARDYAYWEGRAYVTSQRKFATTALALVSTPLTIGFWRASRSHDASLHAALRDLPCTAQAVPHVDRE